MTNSTATKPTNEATTKSDTISPQEARRILDRAAVQLDDDTTKLARQAICDGDGCHNEAASFDSGEVMFVCREHENAATTKRTTTTHPITIEYTRATITLPPEPDVEYSEYHPYNPEHNTYEMMVAGDTGLAYMDEPIDDDTCYTVVHLPSGRFLNIGWFVETERLAQKWIEWLIQLADWTGPVPQIKPGMLFEVFALMNAGMLVDHRLEDDPERFNPVEQLQFASDVA